MKIASTFMLWFIVFLTACISIFFLRFAEVADRTSEFRIHDQLATKLLLIDQAKDLAIWFGGICVVFGILMWVYMMVYTHRLTGPIFKMQKALEKAIHNRSLPDKKLKFRKTDAFHELAELFNQFVETCCESKKKD